MVFHADKFGQNQAKTTHFFDLVKSSIIEIAFSSRRFLSPESVINGLLFSINDFLNNPKQHLALPPIS
jgi:hypothetical protein